MKLCIKLGPWAVNLFLWIICLMPMSLHLPAPISRADLFYHGLSYALVTTAFLIGYSDKKLLICLGLILQGVAIEYIQPMTGRMFEFYDMIANSAGVIFAMLLWPLFIERLKSALFKKFNLPS